MPTFRIVNNYSAKDSLRLSGGMVHLDMKENMTATEKLKVEMLAHCKRITGNQPRWALRNMMQALSMCPAINTPEEDERLAAAKYLFHNS
jgi:hypothetical protein